MCLVILPFDLMSLVMPNIGSWELWQKQSFKDAAVMERNIPAFYRHTGSWFGARHLELTPPSTVTEKA